MTPLAMSPKYLAIVRGGEMPVDASDGEGGVDARCVLRPHFIRVTTMPAEKCLTGCREFPEPHPRRSSEKTFVCTPVTIPYSVLRTVDQSSGIPSRKQSDDADRSVSPHFPPRVASRNTMRSLRELARLATRASSLASRAPAGAPPAIASRTRVFTMSSPAAEEVDAYKVGDSTNIKWHEGSVDASTREKALNQKGCVLWFTGLSGSGKSTVAYTLEHALFQRGKIAQVLDGDNIRHGLNSNLGFSAADREENIRRIGEVGKLFADSGMITLISFISPYRADRQKVRERVGDGKFVEVYMKIPLAVCEERDPKGLYKAARAGKIKGFTGIDDPYEEPLNAEIVMEVAKEGGDGTLAPPEKMAAAIIDVLEKKGFLTA